MAHRCEHCPVFAELACRGKIFCAWAAAGDPDPVHLRHIVAVAQRDAGRPLPATIASPCTDPPAAAAAPAGLPLAGDLLEAMARRIGAKRLAELVERRLGLPCGCEERRRKLNELDRLFRKFIGMGPEA